MEHTMIATKGIINQFKDKRQTLRIFFSFVEGELIDICNFGARLSGSIEDLEFPTSSGINVELPSMGLLQSYDDGDLDSGNMHE
ncbi:MAG: hypothetical protein MK212_19700 [Saprospiraceae bacterium]|nr:hypothetical protein [Saprospiraceae bacterium]